MTRTAAQQEVREILTQAQRCELTFLPNLANGLPYVGYVPRLVDASEGALNLLRELGAVDHDHANGINYLSPVGEALRAMAILGV